MGATINDVSLIIELIAAKATIGFKNILKLSMFFLLLLIHTISLARMEAA